GPPARSAGPLYRAELLTAMGELPTDAYSVQRRSGFREFRVMLECFGEVAKRLGRNRVNEVGHGGRKPSQVISLRSEFGPLAVAFPHAHVHRALDLVVHPLGDQPADIPDRRVLDASVPVLCVV